MTGTLISLLGEANVQKLDDMSTNHTMYKEIANGIREAGYMITHENNVERR